MRPPRFLVRERNWCYPYPVTTALAHIMDEVERLSVPERIELRREPTSAPPMFLQQLPGRTSPCHCSLAITSVLLP